MKAILRRFEDDSKQTLGIFRLYRGSKLLMECKTLEPAWEDNRTSISCIPQGEYYCHPRVSAKYKEHYHVQDVEGRTYILIHHGNFRRNTRGCILLGQAHLDIDGDGLRDVTSSKYTMNMLNDITGRRAFTMQVYNPEWT